MSIDLTLPPVTLRKVEKSAASAGLSVSAFLSNFFASRVGLPDSSGRKAIFLRLAGGPTRRAVGDLGHDPQRHGC